MIFIVTVIASLTSIYCLTLASFTWQDVVLGALVSAVLVAIFRKTLLPGILPNAGHVAHIIAYLPVLLWMLLIDILKGTWQVAIYVVGLKQLDHPGIVKIPLGQHSRAGVGIVSLLLTLSPGSFLVEIDWDDSSMLVHYIDASNPVQLRRDVEKYYRVWEYGSHLPPGPDEGGETAPERTAPDA